MANPWGKKQAARSWDHGGGQPVTKRVFFGDVSAETTVHEFRRMVIEEAGAIAIVKQNPPGKSWGLINLPKLFCPGC